jgi:hypothetical protein
VRFWCQCLLLVVLTMALQSIFMTLVLRYRSTFIHFDILLMSLFLVYRFLDNYRDNTLINVPSTKFEKSRVVSTAGRHSPLLTFWSSCHGISLVLYYSSWHGIGRLDTRTTEPDIPILCWASFIPCITRRSPSLLPPFRPRPKLRVCYFRPPFRLY